MSTTPLHHDTAPDGPVGTTRVAAPLEVDVTQDLPRRRVSDGARAVAESFADALCAGDRTTLEALISARALYLVPGRGPVAGVHRGRDAVASTLCLPAPATVQLASAQVTELIVDSDRAFVVIALSGSAHAAHFEYEAAFHLQIHGGQIAAITEYSGDQYTADALLAPGVVTDDIDDAVTGGPAPTDPPRRRRRWWRR
jgi:ketosteroid isomerase-like protein